MKKSLIYVLMVLAIFVVGCDGSDSPAGTTGKLTVTVSYSWLGSIGFGDTDATNPGNGTLHVMIWTADTDFSSKSARITPAASCEITTNPGTHTFTLEEGSYKFFAMYDYESDDVSVPSENDYYSFYDDINTFAAATSLTIVKGSTETATLVVYDDYKLGANGVTN